MAQAQPISLGVLLCTCPLWRIPPWTLKSNHEPQPQLASKTYFSRTYAGEIDFVKRAANPRRKLDGRSSRVKLLDPILLTRRGSTNNHLFTHSCKGAPPARSLRLVTQHGTVQPTRLPTRCMSESGHDLNTLYFAAFIDGCAPHPNEAHHTCKYYTGNGWPALTCFWAYTL